MCRPDIAVTDGGEGKGLQLRDDREARFQLLWEIHASRVARYVSRRASRDDVQDIVSETFLTAWRRLEDMPEDPVPWLFVTARNLIGNTQRAQGRRTALHDRLARLPRWEIDATEQEGPDPELLAAIRRLPIREREALMLVAWDGLDHRRAALAAGCTQSTFRVRLHRARRRLIRELSSTRPLRTIETNAVMEETR